MFCVTGIYSLNTINLLTSVSKLFVVRLGLCFITIICYCIVLGYIYLKYKHHAIDHLDINKAWFDNMVFIVKFINNPKFFYSVWTEYYAITQLQTVPLHRMTKTLSPIFSTKTKSSLPLLKPLDFIIEYLSLESKTRHKLI